MWVYDAATSKWQVLGGGGSSGGGDHGSLNGLYDDDHPHYLTQGRADLRYSLTTHLHDPTYLRPENVIAGSNVTIANNGDGTITISSSGTGSGGGGTGGADEVQIGASVPTVPEIELWVDTETTGTFSSIPDPLAAGDHGALTGLYDNDHPQYVLGTNGVMSGPLRMTGQEGVTHAPTTGAAMHVVTSVNGTAYFDARAPELKGAGLSMRTGTSMRWTVGTDAADETGANTGTNLTFTRYDDNGARIADTLTINRATGSVTVPTDPAEPLAVATKQYVDAKVSDADIATVGTGSTTVAPSQQAIKAYVDAKMIVSDFAANGVYPADTIWIEY